MIESRIENLTTAQRKALAQKLSERLESDEKLVAWYTTDNGQKINESDLRAHLKDHLASAVIPRHFLQLDELPRTTTGKLDRRKLTTCTGTRIEPTEPRNHDSQNNDSTGTLAKLSRIWQEVLQTNNFKPDDNFFEIGGDSLSLIKVIALAGEVDLKITPGQIYENQNLRQLASSIDAQLQRSQQPLLEGEPDNKPTTSQHTATEDTDLKETTKRDAETTGQIAPDAKDTSTICLSARSDLQPLFCIPPGGVAVSGFRHLVSNISAYSCFSPVAVDGKSYEKSVADLAEKFVDQIQAQQPTGPYRLLGTCEGAYIAWEIAQRLEQNGLEVVFLGIIDTPNPSALTFRPLSQRLKQRLKSLHGISPLSAGIQFLKRTTSWLKRRITQAIVNEVHLTRAGSKMGWQFSPTPYAGHATLFKAGHKLESTDFTADFSNGWGDLVKGGLNVYTLPCNRYEMLKSPFAEKLARQIEAAIASERNVARK